MFDTRVHTCVTRGQRPAAEQIRKRDRIGIRITGNNRFLFVIKENTSNIRETLVERA